MVRMHQQDKAGTAVLIFVSVHPHLPQGGRYASQQIRKPAGPLRMLHQKDPPRRVSDARDLLNTCLIASGIRQTPLNSHRRSAAAGSL